MSNKPLTPWTGGATPAPQGTFVEIEHADGDRHYCAAGYKFASVWEHGIVPHVGDIVGYRVVPEEEMREFSFNFGYDMPVPPGTLVEVIHRNGTCHCVFARHDAATDWTRDEDAPDERDIMAYRVIKSSDER